MSFVFQYCRNNLLNIFGISFFSPGGRLYRVQIDLNLIYTISSYNHAIQIYTDNTYNAEKEGDCIISPNFRTFQLSLLHNTRTEPIS